MKQWQYKTPPKVEGLCEYSAKKTDGTRFAEKHLQETFKRLNEKGELVMLIPPPIQWKNRYE